MCLKEGDNKRQAAISCRHVTWSNLSWNWHQTVKFLTSKVLAPDPLDMSLCLRQVRSQSLQNFSRKAILKLQDQLSQHDQCKILNQRHLRCVHQSKFTNLQGRVGFWTDNSRSTLIGGFGGLVTWKTYAVTVSPHSVLSFMDISHQRDSTCHITWQCNHKS